MSAASLDPTAWASEPTPADVSDAPVSALAGGSPHAVSDGSPVRRLSVAEYRRALHWAWHQDPEGRRIHDETFPTSTSPSPLTTPVHSNGSRVSAAIDVTAETSTRDHACAPPAAAPEGVGMGSLGGPVSDVWSPAQTVTITGMHGGAGASTIALGLATAASTRGSTVLVDPAMPVVSGLACVATTELGTVGEWRLGARDELRIERRDGAVLGPARKHPDDLIVLDAGIQDLLGWEQIARTHGYRVLVASTTPASLLRLDTFLATDAECVAVVTGCPRPTRRWRSTLPPALAAAWAAERVVPIRHDNHLAQQGPSTAPVPSHLIEAMHTVLERLP